MVSAAEEAGVAVYQTELIPDGQGEVGRVWVRFRDAASGEMVERSWTIPYDPRAPRLDEATEPMQLAASAVLLGEKLKGGDSGAYVNLDELAKFGAPLRQAYPGNKRVGQLVDMIESARGLEK